MNLELPEDANLPPLSAPLAELLRPRNLDNYVGQEHIIGEGKPLRNLITSGNISSLIFWGPPGCGKTTLALLISQYTNSHFVKLSAVTSQLKDVRDVIEEARLLRSRHKKTILFVDEIHRFNKAQQDAFLPPVEDGTIILIGATTENPSFSVISPLLSRCRVFVLKPLEELELKKLLDKAVAILEKQYQKNFIIDETVINQIISLADGDGRKIINLAEFTIQGALASEIYNITPEFFSSISHKTLLYDKSGEEHFNCISALHKSLRNSDPNASLYWMARMLVAGDDPLYIARRLVRFASEDIGVADPQALVQTLSALQAYQILGSPEGELALIQAVIYLATAPKSNSIYSAYKKVQKEIENSGSLPVPLDIRNAPTQLMKDLGYGKNYSYDHDSPNHFAPKQCLPDKIKNKNFYEPGPFGFEKEIKKRLEWWESKRNESNITN